MFADKLCAQIKTTGSVIVAGCDPRLGTFPKFILEEASRNSSLNEEYVYRALFSFHQLAFGSIANQVAAIKPNLAFFEQYGIGGIRAFKDICALAKDLNLLVIADGKRGDIGSTAEAYSNAYLGEIDILGKRERVFDVDALTINPFLGFDTLSPFIDTCASYGRGIFVLVHTSNPGAKDIQGLIDQESGKSISFKLAEWLAKESSKLVGSSGYSALGAVVGATYPEDAKEFRRIMPQNLFLVPGYGTQGGDAQTILPNINTDGLGAIINISRALFSSFSSLDISPEEFNQEIKDKLFKFNSEINAARTTTKEIQ